MMGDAGVPNESLAGSLFVEVTSLVEQELFSSAVTLGQYMVASAGGASAPPSCKALLADALFGAREWRRAAAHYERALEAAQRQPDGGGVDAVRARVRMARCFMELDEPDDAKKTLDLIPSAERPAHAWMLLGQLLSAGGSVEPAIACYKQVVRLNPFALEAMLALTALSEDDREQPPEPVAPELRGSAAGVAQALTNAHGYAAREHVHEAFAEFKECVPSLRSSQNRPRKMEVFADDSGAGGAGCTGARGRRRTGWRRRRSSTPSCATRARPSPTSARYTPHPAPTNRRSRSRSRS